jgi:predicted hydrocarbon binding protein
MYGIINQALKLHVCEKYGDNLWEQMQQQSGVESDQFISMQRYPDDTTYHLVQAGAQVLNVSQEQLIEEIGYFWVFYMGSGGYKELFTESGDDLLSFLQNLNYLHSRVKSILPALQPPKFECININDTEVLLHYYSSRDGLSPMVLGLVRGLSDWFEESTSIEQTKFKAHGDDHDEFKIQLSAAKEN